MNRKLLFLIFITLIAFLFTGCKADGDYETPANKDDGETVDAGDDINVSQRKIIYKGSARIDTNDLSKTIKTIRDSIDPVEEWFAEENITEDSAYFVVRVKSTRIKEFINSLSESGKVKNLEMSGTDVSLDYYDKTNQIVALEAERSRLVELYQNASSMNDIIQIYNRITDIERNLGQLQSDINKYDSLINYSEVRLNVYQIDEGEELSFKTRFKDAFKTGWSALGVFLEHVAIVFITIFPFLLVLGPIGLGGYFISRYYEKKKNNKK